MSALHIIDLLYLFVILKRTSCAAITTWPIAKVNYTV
jgi:hypothetical protein